MIDSLQVNSPHKMPALWSFDVFFDVGMSKLLNKQFNCWWFKMLWHSCDIIVMLQVWPKGTNSNETKKKKTGSSLVQVMAGDLIGASAELLPIWPLGKKSFHEIWIKSSTFFSVIIGSGNGLLLLWHQALTENSANIFSWCTLENKV